MSDTHPAHDLGLVGISHRTAPLDVLERLALTPGEIAAVYARLAEQRAINDALVLSTCNRTEVYVRGEPSLDVSTFVTETLSAVAGAQRIPTAEYFYRAHGREGVAHLFRVACGLDSMILGEQQILGQVKDAFELSRDHRAPSVPFEQVVNAAVRVAKESRASTEIGKGAVSVASAAVHLASRIFSDFSRRTVVILGAGDTARLAAEHFSKHGPERLLVLNRTPERAEAVVRAVGGEAWPLSRLPEALLVADVVTCAVRTSSHLLEGAQVAAAMAQRPARSLALLDLGLPRNVAPEAGEITNVFLNDLEALKQVVDVNLARRRHVVPQVEELIERELQRLVERQRALEVGPLIGALRQAVEEMRSREVERASAALAPHEREAVDRATRAVVNKLLHGPMTSIKEVARQQEASEERLALIREMFAHLFDDEKRGG